MIILLFAEQSCNIPSSGILFLDWNVRILRALLGQVYPGSPRGQPYGQTVVEAGICLHYCLLKHILPFLIIQGGLQ